MQDMRLHLSRVPRAAKRLAEFVAIFKLLFVAFSPVVMGVLGLQLAFPPPWLLLG